MFSGWSAMNIKNGWRLSGGARVVSSTGRVSLSNDGGR